MKKNKKAVIVVLGMILVVLIGSVVFKYKNTVVYNDNVVNEYMSKNDSLFTDKQDGEIAWENTEKDYNYTDVTNVDDGAVACSSTGEVVKYDLNGNTIWENTEKNYNYVNIVTINDGVIAFSTSCLVKYDMNGNTIWENDEKDNYYYQKVIANNNNIYVLGIGELTKYNGDTGEIEWTKENSSYSSGNYMTKVDDGFILISKNGSDAYIKKVDFDGNFIYNKQSSNYALKLFYGGENTLITVKDGVILLSSYTSGNYIMNMIKFGFDGEFKWADDIYRTVYKGSYDYYNFNYACETADGELIVVDTEYNYLVKMNSGGRIYWKIEAPEKISNLVVSHNCIITVSSTGKVTGVVSKYTNNANNVNYNKNNGEIIWKNTEKDYNYIDVTKVSDGAVACDSYCRVVKYDMNGNIVWENNEKFSIQDDEAYEHIVSTNDGVIACSPSQLVKYDLNGNIVWENDEKEYDHTELVSNNDDIYELGYSYGYGLDSCELTKYNGNTGEIEWTKQGYYRYMTKVDDGIVMVGISNTSSGFKNIFIQKVDFNGNVIFDKESDDYSIDEFNNITALITTKDGVILLGSYENTGYVGNNINIIKFGFDGEFKWADDLVRNNPSGNVNGENFYNFQYGDETESTNKDIFGFDPNAVTLTRFDFNGREIWRMSGNYSLGKELRGVVSFTDRTLVVFENGTVAMLYDSYLDRGELDKLLEEVGQLEESDYSDESWKKLQDAISGAEDLTKQSEIDAKVDEIQEALDNLGVDKSELDSLLEEVGQLEESDYSDESWQALQDAIAGAEDLTKQSEIDAKVNEIQSAMINLIIEGSIEITNVDKKDNSKEIEGATFKLERIDDTGNVDSTFDVEEKTTNSEGKVEFTGLEVGKYKVTEIQTSEGYELLKDSIEVNITGENRNIKLVFQNELKLILPETGTINNTIAFIIVGIVIIVVSMLLNEIYKNISKEIK